jgi:hypothetical protein
MGTPEGGRMGMPTTGGAMGMPQGGRMGMPTKCDGYENAEHRDEVTVRYVNASAETIYIGRTKYECAAEDPFALYSATGENLSPRFKRVTSDCMTCEAMQQSLGCPEICEFGILVEIQPGGSYETTWTATLFQSVAMPKACYANPDSTFDKCARAVQAPDGEYRVVASAWSDVECQLDAGCDCRPSGSGSCSIEDRAVVAGTPREVSAVLDYPAQKQVELRFE